MLSAKIPINYMNGINLVLPLNHADLLRCCWADLIFVAAAEINLRSRILIRDYFNAEIVSKTLLSHFVCN